MIELQLFFGSLSLLPWSCSGICLLLWDFISSCRLSHLHQLMVYVWLFHFDRALPHSVYILIYHTYSYCLLLLNIRSFFLKSGKQFLDFYAHLKKVHPIMIIISYTNNTLKFFSCFFSCIMYITRRPIMIIEMRNQTAAITPPIMPSVLWTAAILGVPVYNI